MLQCVATVYLCSRLPTFQRKLLPPV